MHRRYNSLHASCKEFYLRYSTMRRRYAYNSMRLCDKCKLYVYCDRSAGNEYTMESHLGSRCEANRNPCPKCTIPINDDNLAEHLSESCSGNTAECPDCNMNVYAGHIEHHRLFYCANKKK